MRRSLALLVFAFVPFISAGTPTDHLELTVGAGGELLATLHSAGDAVVKFEYVKDGCSFTPDHPEPCFAFSAADGAETVAITGCPDNKNGSLDVAAQAGCRAANVKSVKLLMANGGTVALNGGTGNHNDCSPVPVTIEAHGDAYHIAAWNGCSETISCASGLGQVDADKSDTVKANCDPAFVTRH